MNDKHWLITYIDRRHSQPANICINKPPAEWLFYRLTIFPQEETILLNVLEITEANYEALNKLLPI